MDSRQEHGKKVKWDDWIGRLIGYLGEYEYMHGHQEVDLDYSWSGEPKADNIVYIYGAEKGGMQECIDLLSEELNGREEYVCYGYSFESADVGNAVLNFQNGFKEAFRLGTPKFQFPCMRLLTAAEAHNEEDGLRDVLSNLLDVSDTLVSSVETMATGTMVQKFFAGKDLLTELWGSKEYLRNMVRGGVEADAVKRLKVKLKDLASRGSVLSAVSAETPFDCLQMDLQINVKSVKKRVICTVNAFELCENRLADKSHRELLLKMMASVPGIVWVLFSSKMPDDEARSVIRRENFWRMGGISKERTIRLLERECPGAKGKWYKAVYHYTGGLVGLVNICMDAHRSGHKFVDDRDGKIDEMMKMAQMLGNVQLIEQLAKMKAGQDEERVRAEENKQGSAQDKEQQELEGWFEKVWNGKFDDDTFFGESERERKDPLDFLFGTGRIDYVEMADDGGDASVRKYLLPCLCYMIKKSLSNVGTVEQYHWRRRHQSLELNELGTRCLLVVEEDPLFCKEYEEYPGILYLDPIIVQVVSKHRNYEMWLQAFEQRCLQRMDFDDHKNLAKENHSYSVNTLLLVDSEGNVHNVKFADVSISEGKSGIAQADISEMKSQLTFAKEESEKPAEKSSGGGQARVAPTSGGQTPQLPPEANEMDSSFRTGNIKPETGQTSDKGTGDRKQVNSGETDTPDKEKDLPIDNDNHMG